MAYLAVGCQVLLGLVFLISAGGKLRDRHAFEQSVRELRVTPSQIVRPVAAGVTAVELAVPLLLAASLLSTVSVLPPGAGTVVGQVGFGLAALLLISFSAVIAVSLRRGVRAPCRCFGHSTTPLGVRHLVRNSLLTGGAGLGAFTVGSAGDLAPVGLVVAAVTGLAAATLVAAMDDIVALFSPGPGRQLPRQAA